MEWQATVPSRELERFGVLLASSEGDGAGGRDILVVVAHPDDETIGLGGQLRHLRNATILHVTDGAPRDMRDTRAYGFGTWQAYAAARRRELERAMAEAEHAAETLSFDIPDQGAVHCMATMARRLTDLFTERRPRFVCTHAFDGGHPDHDATAFAVHAACRSMLDAGGTPPSIIEMAFYHAGPGGAVFQEFAAEPCLPVLEIDLGDEAWAEKQRMLAHHATQQSTLRPFTSRVERFRSVPTYDFGALPNGGNLLYETLPLGFAGKDWPDLVSRAWAALERAPA